MAAMSPRDPAPKLESDSVEDGKPRRTKSPFAKVALGRGYTVQLSERTSRKLTRGIPKASRKED
jgi:hypothetical protein